MKIFTFIASIILFNIVNCQDELLIKGYVLDSNNNPLEYCLIKLNNDYKGTYTDSTGYFVLKNIKSDSLSFYMLGYENLTCSIQSFKKNKKINLNFLHSTLDPVFITPKKEVLFSVENKKNQHNSITCYKGWAIGYYLNQHKGKYLKNSEFYFDKIENENTIVSIKVLKKTKDNLLSNSSILDETLIYKLPLKSKKIIIDFEKYHIKIPKDGLILSFEVLSGKCKMHLTDLKPDELTYLTTWGNNHNESLTYDYFQLRGVKRNLRISYSAIAYE